MYLIPAIVGLVLISNAAMAQIVDQAPPKTQENMAMRGLILALQQIGVAAEQYVTDVKQQLAAKDARIAEWEAYFKAYTGVK